MYDLISILSEIRSQYNCFDPKEEPYYRALSEAIGLISAQKTQLSEEDATKGTTFDYISRQAAIDALGERPMVWVGSDYELGARNQYDADVLALETVPSAQPERLTDDDFETIRIHLNAFKEQLCNQRRWKEAEEYQRIIDRFMAFATAQPENMRVNLDIQKITTHKSDFSDLDELPSAQEQRWIPVTERLPKANGRYLVTRGLVAAGALWNRVYIANYSDLMGIKSKKIWWQGNVGKSDFQRIDDVIAWMPLPESWKGEEDEQIH